MKTNLLNPNPTQPALFRPRTVTGAVRPSAGTGLGRFNASVRVPVTRANRAYLRAARAAELAAWEGVTASAA